MAARARIRRRLTLAIVLTALVPMLVALVLARAMVRQTAARFFVPEIGAHLDQALGVYQDLAHAVKAAMRSSATAIAARETLARALRSKDGSRLEGELERAVRDNPGVVSLSVTDESGRVLAEATRGRPLDPGEEHGLEVVRLIAQDGGAPMAQLVALYATDRARFEELESMSRFVDTYRQVERRRSTDEISYLYAFALLLGITIVAAAGVAVVFAQSVSSRIVELAAATRRVGEGDLSISVPERGRDEITELARAFNRMVQEVQASRARIEYLQRIGAWQEMARRLAHEIKNPLTPIQLAVQELHSRYHGDDPGFRRLVDSTLEIVEDEVHTLRRLVSEFSDFARLPRAELAPADLAVFLREQCDRIQHTGEGAESGLEQRGLARSDRAAFELTASLTVESAPVNMDGEMLRRVLLNLIQNATEASRDSQRVSAKVQVHLHRDGDYWVVDVDDDGPGVDSALREKIFDPYVTTKHSGTGLGLAIVKKAVVEHGGSIEAGVSPLGGARFRIRLPALRAGPGKARTRRALFGSARPLDGRERAPRE
ncbi:MAG: HAMP domain-containing protein [Polyangiaceae bacterium]|nr:HAMP domain-containing protein [Polyangiaceae bacterium]